jgi:hypothetical protein
MKTYVSIFGLVGALILANGLDRGVNSLKETGVRTFVLTPYLWGAAIANLILACALLGLFWLIFVGHEAGRFAGLVFIIAGLTVTFYPSLARSIPSLHLPLTVGNLVGFDSRFSIAGAFIAAMGIFRLASIDTRGMDRFRHNTVAREDFGKRSTVMGSSARRNEAREDVGQPG